MAKQISSLDEYAEHYTSAEGAVLAALNRETNIKRGDAVMLSGHMQGAFLQMVSSMVRPRRILEIGTYTGYSAICLAQGLHPDGHLHTIEQDEELEAIAAAYFDKAGLQHKITQHIGSAADLIPELNEMFDLVFIDADKVNYSVYYDLVFDKVNVGGYILADNVLYAGEVILPEEQQSKNAKAIQCFNDRVKTDDRVAHFLLPLRDGIQVIRKIKN
jgi:caffeoyl-CoA O-methyltransferase